MSVLILLIFITCSSNQNKFIELKNAVNILEKNEKLNYSLSDCHSLEQYDSLYAYFEQHDSLHACHKEIILTKKYKNIEALITNLDENLISYLKGTFGIELKIDFPVLKYKNRAFLMEHSLDSWSSYIIELREPQKATIALMQRGFDSPAHMEIIKIEDPVEEKRNANEPYRVVEEMPQFPNGGEKALLQFLRENTRYPELAKNANIRGNVVISFVIEKDGSIGEIEIVRSLCKSCDEEAIRMVKSMPAWIPGRHNGVNVAVKYTIPVSFPLRSA